MASRKSNSSKPDIAQDGTTPTPRGEVAELLNEVGSWSMPEIEDEDEAEKRIGEYFNLCVSKNEMPLFETLCLYLGIGDEKGKDYVHGEGCSVRMTKLMTNALTKLKAAEAKAVYKGIIRDVPYIWRSKQYFDYREPNSKLEDILAGNLLKELPSASSVASKYQELLIDPEEEVSTEAAEVTGAV